MGFQFLEHWHDFLPTGGGHVVAVSGGRGRCALLRLLVTHWRSMGVPLVTVGFDPGCVWPAVAVEAGASVPQDAGCRLQAPLDARGWAWLDETAVGLVDRIVLVDLGPTGQQRVASLPTAGGRPSTTGLLLHVVDLSAIGRPAAEVVSADDALAVTAARRSDPLAGWQWDDMANLLQDAVAEAAPLPPWALVLLELDGCRDSIGLFGFLGRCMDELPVPLVTLGSIDHEESSLRTACNADVGRGGEQT